jgi:hypothetical protein
VVRPLWRENGSVFCMCRWSCQRSLSRVLVPWDLSPYFTVSDLRLPFSSPPTTRRVTVEVFDPASTRVYLLAESESESESYVTTDGQSASPSWYKAPIRGLRLDLFSVRNTEYGIRLTVTFLIPWVTLSDERMGLSFVCAAGPCQPQVFLGSESLGIRDRILLSQIWDFPFRRLLRLAGSRWRYSTPPPHGSASGLVLYSRGTDNAENRVLLLRSADHTENTSNVIAITQVHWSADCCLATSYKHSPYCCVRVTRAAYWAVAWQCVDISQYVVARNWKKGHLW